MFSNDLICDVLDYIDDNIKGVIKSDNNANAYLINNEEKKLIG